MPGKRKRLDTGHLAFRNSARTGVEGCPTSQSERRAVTGTRSPPLIGTTKRERTLIRMWGTTKSRLFDSPKGFERAGPALCV